MNNSFVKKLQQFSFHKELLKRDNGIVIGISGGPDSVALACVLNKLKEKHNFQIKLVHINYHQRGEDSNRDEQFVSDFAEKNKLELEVFDYQKGSSKNLEEDMRNFRYEIFEKVREKVGFEKIAIGHTKDDQVETFLMNLIRGAGIEGLISLKEKRDKIIRPLMSCEKEEILDFLKSINQDFCKDESNLDIKFSRNKIRKNLIPLLQKDYNKNIKNQLFDLSGHLRDDLEVIEDISKKVYIEKVFKYEDGFFIEIKDLMGLRIALQKRIFRNIIEKIIGNIRDISTANFFEFQKIFQSKKSKNSEMQIRGLLIYKKGNKIYFKKK